MPTNNEKNIKFSGKYIHPVCKFDEQVMKFVDQS